MDRPFFVRAIRSFAPAGANSAFGNRKSLGRSSSEFRAASRLRFKGWVVASLNSRSLRRPGAVANSGWRTWPLSGAEGLQFEELFTAWLPPIVEQGKREADHGPGEKYCELLGRLALRGPGKTGLQQMALEKGATGSKSARW